MYSGPGNNVYATSTRCLQVAKERALLGISLFAVVAILLIMRLAFVMIFPKKYNNEGGVHYDSVSFTASRANIVDRNGIIVATSLPTVSVYACPHEIIDPKEAAEKISSVFVEINKQDLEAKLRSKKKFIWVKRNLSPHQEQLTLNQGIPGMRFLKTERRVYPDKNLFAHVVGGTDIDNIGIAGIEKVFDHALRELSDSVALSIDIRTQHAVHDELSKSIEEFKAIGGAAIVMNIKTGEIMAMVSLPDFDPNQNANPNSKERFNMTSSSAIEPGSSAKIFNTAMALETGRITPFSQYDARYPIKIGRFTIHDFKGKATFLSVEEILKFSSNIGSAKIAIDVGAKFQKQFFRHIGLLDTVSCELPETQHPLFPKNWSEASAMTIAYGHGIAFSPLHLIAIFSGLLNDGMLQQPTLLKRSNAIPIRRIISSKTSRQLRALLRLNVTEGSNKFADVPGYLVGGKSGTAEKQKGGRYLKNTNYAGFVGAFPMTNPQYAIYVVLDEPQSTEKTNGYRTAGWNAAPCTANIIKRIGPLLNIAPHHDMEPDWKGLLKNKI